ncbi:VWA domain-containing protein [Adhaeribacter radiodurans]|uniref:phospholipase D n=1 Tax=Adhaeribacter radiodurans TaxID=2745197 RepID=A0A7L7LF02_9BACT|nr:VWA domain-containing protein [Adhaeribacter radiodurans]QMU31363.1 VWA domain-containing protein [Adhaeribacter radiodurans]
MINTELYIGVLKKVTEREAQSNKYYTGWIESPQIERTFFHPNALASKDQINFIGEDKLVTFGINLKKTKTGDRQDATNCNLNCENYIIKELLNYDTPVLELIFRYAKPSLIQKISRRIRNIENRTLEDEIKIKIANIKSRLPKECNNAKVIENDVLVPSIPLEPNSTTFSFLQTIFHANTPEYNVNLFRILVEGIKTIENAEVYDQAKFLLEYNKKESVVGYEDLTASFYQKSTNDYKFKLWFDGITDYCDTDILKDKFETGDDAVKHNILQRCKGSENGYLVLDNQVKKTTEIEEVYFSGIKRLILQELGKAKKSIQIAVAWFTNAELFDMLCNKLEEGVKVELIIINDYINNWEYGLPFEKFVSLNGKLYFSDYPALMHHKFCIIDEDVIFNGSYNWTYYADSINNENIMLLKGKHHLVKAFLGEFDKLKSKLGEVQIPIVPFDASQIHRFERMAYRNYLSKDVEFKAREVKNSNVIYSDELISQALKLYPENTGAENYKLQIAPEVALDHSIIEVQKIVAENLITETTEIISKEIKEQDTNNKSEIIKNISEEVPVEKVASINDSEANLQSNKSSLISEKNISESKVSSPLLTVNETSKKTHASPIIISNNKPTNVVGVPPNFTQHNSARIELPKTLSPITSFAIPSSAAQGYMFENLQLVFALDYSNSMENYGKNEGYKLYSSGKIQKVINMIFAISKGLTSEQNIDLFLFEKKSVRLPIKVTKHNYQNFIEKEILNKYEMNGTDIYAPIADIHKNYIDAKINKIVFVILITDGENNSTASNEQMLKYFQENGDTSIFWQFVGLGAQFTFLEKLEAVSSNVSFFQLNDVQQLSNDDLKNRLLQKFPKWYAEVKSKVVE